MKWLGLLLLAIGAPVIISMMLAGVGLEILAYLGIPSAFGALLQLCNGRSNG